MAGIGNVQLGVNLTGSDVHNMRLTRTATGMGAPTGGFIWNPTTRHILKREETDKQNDDNLTFLFEYRALLNSRVQTLITQLSNALASDLDVALNAANNVWGNDRPAMNGLSTNTVQDPGAGRAAYNYMLGWFTTANTGATNFTPGPNPASPVAMAFTSGPNTVDANGTATIVSAENKVVDMMTIANLYSGNPTIQFSNAPTALDNRLDNNFNGPLGQAAINAQAKNLFEKVLFDAISSIEYRAVLSSGLFKNLVVSASSSLPTGSQMQASFSLNFNGAQDGGNLLITMDKMTAFYHS
ncbi:MAG: hypothetical protein CVV27_07855 [Candidatus Melainabacteria bacterium HGW-Melainabacteria-1]|nr:MAG: hypothetical protein CVV27_07855 [Candidatus Melainabacteria bacterium HGW-Melainabacteria-1]